MISRIQSATNKIQLVRTTLSRFSSTSTAHDDAVGHIFVGNRCTGTPETTNDMPTNVLDVSPLAEKMRREVRSYTRKHDHVRLVGILASEGDFREDAEMYSERISETFFEDGIEYELVRCKANNKFDVEKRIREMNARKDVHGILVFYPIFHGMRANLPKTYLNKMNGTYYRTHDDSLRDMVHPSKDVEALCAEYNARRFFRARSKNRTPNEVYVPCTALAVAKILETYHQQIEINQQVHMHQCWQNSNVTIINRSEIFGRPLAALLALHGATVYSVDEDSILQFQQGGRMRRCTEMTLEKCLERSSVVVSGVPNPDFRLPPDRIRDGTTIVNVSEFCNVDEADFFDRPNVTLITQVGKVTVAALEHNLIRLHQAASSKVVTSVG